ncbi:MAG: hypothetical protein LBQ15_05280 [Clostridium sp.]|nr:hypothetical protein [Clostridium sp.]
MGGKGENGENEILAHNRPSGVSPDRVPVLGRGVSGGSGGCVTLASNTSIPPDVPTPCRGLPSGGLSENAPGASAPVGAGVLLGLSAAVSGSLPVACSQALVHSSKVGTVY